MSRVIVFSARAAMLFMVGISSVLVSGCSSYIGLVPVSPAFGEIVDDVQPSMRWEAAPEEGVTYELFVYEANAVDGSRGEGADPDPVYARKGLTITRHRIEKLLDPGVEYAWSVRYVKGGDVSPWSVRASGKKRQLLKFRVAE
jgi:hypothetical protein